MTRRRILLVMAVVLVGAVVAVFVWPKEKEPEYQGRKLSEWLARGYSQNSRYETELATGAVRAIGTNALPFLLKWIRHDEPPRWRRPAFWIVNRLPRGRLQDRMIDLANDDSNYRRANSANFGFDALGTNAIAAMPQLTRLLRCGQKEVQRRAVMALAAIGKEALPPLLAVARDEHYGSRRDAVLALCRLQVPDGTMESQTIIRFLLECLRKRSPQVLDIAAGCMPSREFDLTVPALVEFSKSADFKELYQVMLTLGRFGTNACPAAMRLVFVSLEDSHLVVRQAATNALGEMAPEELKILQVEH